MSDPVPPAEPEVLTAAEKVKLFPPSPGVYLMKDAQGRVLYVGKAKNLRNRASHYFTKIAAAEERTSDLVKLICDIDFVACDSDVDALLMEARLIKDVQPRFNVVQKDDKSFPYLQIRMREDFPRVEFTRTPRRRGVKLYGPFTSAKSLRAALQVLQRIFKFRTCGLDIEAEDQRWRWFRPCILHSINQCTAPCNFRVTREDYRKQIRDLRLVLEGKKSRLLAEMEREMQEASQALLFEKAARLRDEIHALKNLGQRGDVAPLPPSPAPPPGRGGPAPARHPAHSRRQGPAHRGSGRLSAPGRRAALPDLAGQARGGSLPARGGRTPPAEPACGCLAASA